MKTVLKKVQKYFEILVDIFVWCFHRYREFPICKALGHISVHSGSFIFEILFFIMEIRNGSFHFLSPSHARQGWRIFAIKLSNFFRRSQKNFALSAIFSELLTKNKPFWLFWLLHNMGA